MTWDYGCPSCGATLNPRETIVLVGEHADTRVLVGFHPQPGNYDTYLPKGVTAEPGTRWAFHCPLCQADLAVPEDDDLCAVELRTGGEVKRVLFSRVAGDRATFVFSPEGLDAHYGPDAPHHLERVLSEGFIVHPV